MFATLNPRKIEKERACNIEKRKKKAKRKKEREEKYSNEINNEIEHYNVFMKVKLLFNYVQRGKYHQFFM